MKKFIKDWWPLLVILAVVAWKKHHTRNQNKYYSQGGPIMPPEEKVTSDYIRALEKAGYVKAGKCQSCGNGDIYRKIVREPYNTGNPEIANTYPVGDRIVYACTNQNCKYFSPRFMSYY